MEAVQSGLPETLQMAILYFSVSDAVWNVKAGEDAPLSAKWVASLVLLSWIGVIMGGRLLPYV